MAHNIGFEGSFVIRIGHMIASIPPSGLVTNKRPVANSPVPTYRHHWCSQKQRMKGWGVTRRSGRSGMIRASRQIVWPFSKTTGTTGVAPHITAFWFCSVSSMTYYTSIHKHCSNKLGCLGQAFQAVCPQYRSSQVMHFNWIGGKFMLGHNTTTNSLFKCMNVQGDPRADAASHYIQKHHFAHTH